MKAAVAATMIVGASAALDTSYTGGFADASTMYSGHDKAGVAGEHPLDIAKMVASFIAIGAPTGSVPATGFGLTWATHDQYLKGYGKFCENGLTEDACNKAVFWGDGVTNTTYKPCKWNTAGTGASKCEINNIKANRTGHANMVCASSKTTTDALNWGPTSYSLPAWGQAGHAYGVTPQVDNATMLSPMEYRRQNTTAITGSTLQKDLEIACTRNAAAFLVYKGDSSKKGEATSEVCSYKAESAADKKDDKCEACADWVTNGEGDWTAKVCKGSGTSSAPKALGAAMVAVAVVMSFLSF